MRIHKLIFATTLFSLIAFAGYSQKPKVEYPEEKTALYLAVEKGNVTEVSRLLKTGNDPNESFYFNPLKEAITTENLAITKLLVEHGATMYQALNTAAGTGNKEIVAYLIDQNLKIGTSLVDACESKNMEVVKLLVKAGADVNLEQKRRKGFLNLRKYYVSPIEIAIVQNNKPLCQYLIEKGVSFLTAFEKALENDKNTLAISLANNRTQSDYNAAMLKAFEYSELEVVKHCVNQGADKNITDEQGKTVFLKAVESGDLEVTNYCIDELGASYATVLSTGENALHLAAKTDNIQLIDYLLGLGLDKEAKNLMGETPLYFSLKSRTSKAFFHLVKNEADITQKTKINSNLLIEAAKNQHLDIVEFLLDKGVPVNEKNELNETAIQFVVADLLRNVNLLHNFIEKGADVNSQTENGKTLLYYAVEKGKLEVISYLLDKGADINLLDKNGQRPKFSSATVVKFIIEKGADINAKDNRSDTYLCDALKQNDLELALFLINKGIDIEQNCYFRESVLIKAIEDKNLEFVKVLVQNNANVNATNRYGKTMLEIAQKSENQAIVDFLKANGAMTKEEKNASLIKKTATSQELKDAIKTINLAKISELLEVEGLVISDKELKQIAELSAAQGNLEVLDKMMAEFNLEINKPVNVNNQSLLIIAVINDKINVVNYLLDRKVNLQHKDYFNKIAIDYAKNGELKKMLKN